MRKPISSIMRVPRFSLFFGQVKTLWVPHFSLPLREVGIFLLIIFLALSSSSTAQSQQTPISKLPASARQLVAIKVAGSKRYSEAEIAAASGLQLGTPVTEDDFKRASRRLGDMGVFTDIAYSFSYSPAGTKLEFHVTDAQKFVPVRFEDFVWFSDEEMLRRIKDHAPLFNGELPLSGRLPDEVSDVLQTMLVERSIPGHVDYVRSGPSNGPVDSILYKVSDVVIQIRNIEFTGATEAELPALKAASKRVFDSEYSRSVLNALVQHQLLPVYYARGYLKAAFGSPEPKVVKQPSAAGDDAVRNLTIVDVTFAVTPGQQYKLAGVEWSGNQEFPADTLQKMVRAPVGETANTVRISDNLKDIQKLYGSRGYVTAALAANTAFDDAAGTVVIHIDLKEGPVFHMGELEFRGLDNSLTAKLRNAWKIRPGDVYDTTYLSQYLPEAHKLLPPALDWDVSSHVTANVRDKTVDVDLIYSAKAPK
jgi:outer membrane protein assembly factor BamA